MTKSIICIDDLSQHFTSGEKVVHVLDGINLNVNEGDFIAIQGRSGSGKSTFLNLLGGFMKPSKGSIQVDSLHLEKLNEDRLCLYRRKHVGFIFQSFHLFQNMSALENVEEPLFYMGVRKKERKARAKEMLEKVGLGDRLNHSTHQLSGGQQQRVSIARALVTNPNIILADEPTGNLDSETEEEVLQLLLHINRDLGKTLVLVTHDDQVAKLANRRLRMAEGLLLES